MSDADEIDKEAALAMLRLLASMYERVASEMGPTVDHVSPMKVPVALVVADFVAANFGPGATP